MSFQELLIYSFILILATSSFVDGVGISFEQDVTLSLEQKELLDKFKERVISKLPEPYMKTELNLIKWLRSSKFDVNLAESRILGDVEWRRNHKMDTILSEDWSDMWNNGFRYYLDGRDKAGRSFLFVDAKDMDMRKAVLQGKGERMLRYSDKMREEGCSLIRSLGQKYGNMTRANLLVNLDGFNIIQHSCLQCLPYFVRMISHGDHWPECIDKVILVNAPSSIYRILEIVRPLLDEESRNSIFAYGTNVKEWRKALGTEFDFSQLPPVLGGTKLYKGMEDEDFLL